MGTCEASEASGLMSRPPPNQRLKLAPSSQVVKNSICHHSHWAAQLKRAPLDVTRLLLMSPGRRGLERQTVHGNRAAVQALTFRWETRSPCRPVPESPL